MASGGTRQQPSCAVLKLGGSLITCAEQGLATTDASRLLACARDIARSGVPVVVVHGTGSFGKPPARHHGYLDGRLSAERSAVVANVATSLARLELDVIEALDRAGLRPLRLPPLTLFHADGGRAALADSQPVRHLLWRGITPVIGGNFIIDRGGFAVCSSDLVAAELAIALDARALVLATRARGVYRDAGRSEAIFETLGATDCAALDALDAMEGDVSGGIRAKIDAGLRAAVRGIPTWIVDGRLPGNLCQALAGAPCVGTRLVAAASHGVS